MKKTILILSLFCFNANADTLRINLNSGDLIGNAYNYFSGNSQDNPTIFDSSSTKREKLQKIRQLQRIQAQTSITNHPLNNTIQKESKLVKVLNTPITKNGLKKAGLFASEGIVATKGSKTFYKTVLKKHSVGVLGAGTMLYAGAQTVSGADYKHIIQSATYTEIYDKISAQISVVQEKLSRDKKYRECTFEQAKKYLTLDPEDFEILVNQNLLHVYQINNTTNTLYNVNSYKRNIRTYKTWKLSKYYNGTSHSQDHVPSKAAISEALGVSGILKNNVKENASTLDIFTDWHRDGSATYLYKNRSDVITSDANDLFEATHKDLAMIGAYLLQNSSQQEKDKYVKAGMLLYTRNALLCLYSK